MKDSGIPWIGMIPSDWEVKRLKEVFSESKEKSLDGVGDLLSLSQYTGVKLRRETDFAGTHEAESNEGYNVVHKGQLVMNIMLAWNGSYALSDYDGLISPAYCVFNFKIDCVKRYFHYLLRTSGYPSAFKTMSRGIIDSRLRLYPEQFYTFPTIYPPLSTQQRIADFLDRKCAEIDKLAALQETMIDELKRYKQSVITEAVTKGLDPNVPMKDSGVEWIGEIPEGWEVKKVKNVTTAITKGNGITKEEVFADGDTPCVRYGEIYSKYDNSFVSCISKTKKDVLSTFHYFGNGDILCAGTGELVEEIGKSIVYLGENQCLAGGDIIVLSHNQNPLFLNFALNSRYAQAQKSCSKAKLKVVHISAYDIGSVLIAFPPFTEQRAIADYLDKKCAEIDKLIAIKQQKIEALKEYKKSVIFEYVTGKKEVEE